MAIIDSFKANATSVEVLFAGTFLVLEAHKCFL